MPGSMAVYLPIAEIGVNGLTIMMIGLLVGFLSGMFGVGGGFLTTPLLIFYGIPPVVAVASAATQTAGASVSGALAYMHRRAVDYKMGAVLILGGVFGALLGSLIFRWLKMLGQVDTAVSIAYVVLLGSIGSLMLIESTRSLIAARYGQPARRRINRHNMFVAALPFRMKFRQSGLYISPLAPLLLGAVIGILTMIMGVGGGFMLVPALIYILGMPATVVIGTSLFQIVFVTATVTLLHAVDSHSVDVVLALLLLVGGVFGAQLGARAAERLPARHLRFGLAVIVLALAVRLLIGLIVRPDQLFTVWVT